MLTRLLMVIAVVGVSPALADCTVPTTNDVVVQALEDATQAFEKLEVDAFNEASGRAGKAVDCLAEPISRATAADFHRVQGLALFLERNAPAAQRSFAAARSLEPDYAFPTDLVPIGNPVRADYEALDPNAGPFEQVEGPQSGSLRLNGLRSLNRSMAFPIIFQRLDAKGAVVQTVQVESGQALPAYEQGPVVGPESPVPPDRPPRRGVNKPLLIIGAVGLAAAAGLYGGAYATKSSLGKAGTVEAAEKKASTANTLVITSVAVGAVGLGTGAASFMVSGSF